MKNSLFVFNFFLGLIFVLTAGCGVPASTTSDGTDDGASDETLLPQLSVFDNRIINAAGVEVRLRGINMEDPYVMDNQDIDDDGVIDSHFDEVGNDFQRVKDLGANVVRLTVVPGIYRELGESYLTDYYDRMIDLASENNLYAIIDFHAIGRPGGWYPSEFDDTTMPEHPVEGLYYTDLDDARIFWETMADRYGDREHVLFDIYNEPADQENDFTWEDWRPYGEELISTIREHSDNLILGPGPYWTSDLSDVSNSPYSDDNLVYVVHIYPGSLDEGADQLEEWGNRFGFLTETYPVIVSEWGFEQGGDETTNGTLAKYGEALIDYLDENDIHWLAYIYHPLADPNMLETDWTTLTEFGEFVAERLQE